MSSEHSLFRFPVHGNVLHCDSHYIRTLVGTFPEDIQTHGHLTFLLIHLLTYLSRFYAKMHDIIPSHEKKRPAFLLNT